VTGRRVVWLVTRRELREGVRGRQFLYSTVVLLLLLGGVVALSAIFGNENTVRIGVGGRAPALLIRELAAAAKPLDEHLELHRYADAAAARVAVAHRKVDVAFAESGHRLLTRADSAGNALRSRARRPARRSWTSRPAGPGSRRRRRARCWHPRSRWHACSRPAARAAATTRSRS
jgi:hypothetical protein